MIEVVTAVYNEELLMPLFLRHYWFADVITILLDDATTDRTPEILAGDKRVQVQEVNYPEKLNWVKKSDIVNAVALSSEADWVFAVDADEFIWTPDGSNMMYWLDQQDGNVIQAGLWCVYRHRTDTDIEYNQDPKFQRRHGNPLLGFSYGEFQYIKPCVIRPESKAIWGCGIHGVLLDRSPNVVFSKGRMYGAHWCMADPKIALYRRLQQKERQGKENLEHGWGVQNHYITKEQILAECEAHLDDPRLF